MNFCFRIVALLLAFVALAAAREGREQARIDFLLGQIEQAKDVVFIRNGAEHDGQAAAKHLRKKLDYAGERVKTAEDFVRYCASESSLTHQRYMVKLSGGKTMPAADYLSGKLREFDAAKQ